MHIHGSLEGHFQHQISQGAHLILEQFCLVGVE